MVKFIYDFIQSGLSATGVGNCSRYKAAVRNSRTISKYQIKRFEKKGEIPPAVYRYLFEVGIISSPSMPKDKSIYGLLDILWHSQNRDGKPNQEAECLYKHIQLSIHPELRPRRLNERRARRKKA
jgi:hypothetical protein